MHMDSPNYLCECGTTHTRHFVRVMLVDFHLHNLSEVCYWNFICIIFQRYVTGLSLHNLPEVYYWTFLVINAQHHAIYSI